MPSYTYNYTRSIIQSGYYAGYWDIDNPNKVDSDGNQIYLAKEIEAIINNKNFEIRCNGSECEIEFDEELNSTEQNNLNIIVANHKSASGHNPVEKTIGEENFHLEESQGGKLVTDSWYSIDNGDGSYSWKTRETKYIYSGNNVISREERTFYKDGTVANLEIWDYYNAPPNYKIIKKRDI